MDRLMGIQDRKASSISDEDDTVMESSSPNYRTHLEAFQDSQDPYDMWHIRQNDRMTDPLENNYDKLQFISMCKKNVDKDKTDLKYYG